MDDKKDQDRLEALKQRLYDRGEGQQKREHFELTDEKLKIRTSWQPKKTSDIAIKEEKPTVSVPIPEQAPASVGPATTEPETTSVISSIMSKRKSYRLKFLLAGIFFFVLSVAISSLFILFGGRAISGENIAINITGPFTIGGGENIPLQIGITNQNSVPIESATLVVEYPLGTQSATEVGRELFVERLPLNIISSGETVNIPLKAQVFGEENQELAIRASVEYRVKGSNATFYKEAEPLSFKISSSPVVVSIDAVKNISSGQETTVKLTIKSNAPAILSDILVKAEYPSGFDYTKSTPSPVSGHNVWIIEKLEPEGSAEINITGIVVGTESEEHVMNFSVGVPNERDRLSLASVFAVASTEFLLEQPFIDVSVVVNGVKNDTAAIAPGEQSSVSVVIKNTLQDSIYDGVVELKLSGNALSDAEINVSNGYYDSNTRTIVWDISSTPDLERIVPGASENFNFSLAPRTDTLLTPQINIDAVVKARRVSESNAQEELVGTVKSTIKVESGAEILSETGYNIGPFGDNGPIPPEVGETTTYTITLQVDNGSNNISNAIVTATLPSYVNWLPETAGVGTFSYNPSTRLVEWKVGSLLANQKATGAFHVSILPSISQIDKTPTLVGEQRLKADDNFTGTVIRAIKEAVTTQMPEESGYERDNGDVRGG